MYNIFLKIENVALQLPINPEEIKFKYETSINRYDIIGLGEIAEVNTNKLVETNINSFIPKVNTNLITNSDITAQRFFETLDEARENGKVVELVINRDSMEDLALDCLIGVINIIEKAGEVDDVYYELQLIQWIDHEPTKLVIQKPAPLPLIIPVNQTFSQTNNENKTPVRKDTKDSANTSVGFFRGAKVICNGNGYSFKSGFLEGIGAYLKCNNEEGIINNIFSGEKYPYQVTLTRDFVVLGITIKKNNKIDKYFKEEDLSFKQQGGSR